MDLSLFDILQINFCTRRVEIACVCVRLSVCVCLHECRSVCVFAKVKEELNVFLSYICSLHICARYELFVTKSVARRIVHRQQHRWRTTTTHIRQIMITKAHQHLCQMSQQNLDRESLRSERVNKL